METVAHDGKTIGTFRNCLHICHTSCNFPVDSSGCISFLLVAEYEYPQNAGSCTDTFLVDCCIRCKQWLEEASTNWGGSTLLILNIDPRKMDTFLVDTWQGNFGIGPNHPNQRTFSVWCLLHLAVLRFVFDGRTVYEWEQSLVRLVSDLSLQT